MPRTLLSDHVKVMKRPKINVIQTILNGYIRAGGLTCDNIGKELGISGSAVRKMLGRPTEDWRVKEIDHMCDFIGCPKEDIYIALSRRR